MLPRSVRRWMAPATLGIAALLATTSVASAAPPVLASGTFSIPASYTFDLDHGVLQDAPYADAWFELATAGEHSIEPIRSEMVKWGNSMPTYKQCKNAMVSGGGSWDLDENLGKWFCDHTNKGHVNRFKVISVSDDELVLKFTTWKT